MAQRAAEAVAAEADAARASITDFQGALGWEVARQITEHVREVEPHPATHAIRTPLTTGETVHQAGEPPNTL